MAALLSVVLAVVVSCSPQRPSEREPAPPNAPSPQEHVPDVTMAVLGIESRSSAGPSIASAGQTVAVAWTAAGRTGRGDVYAAVSADAGRTFRAAVRVNDAPDTVRLGGELSPRVAVTAANGVPVIHVVWTAEDAHTSIRMARSTDGGRTFAPSRELQSGSAAGDRGWAALALDAGGTPHAIWLDHRDLASTPGGSSHHHSHAASPPSSSPQAAADGVAMAQRSGLYYSNGSSEQELARGVCYCCKTAIAAGAGGELFAAWRHVYPGNLRDIAFAVSPDGGATFRDPLRVSEDHWELDGCPDDGPAMAVDAQGTVHLVWPTVVSQPSPYKGVFYATRDRSGAFSPRVAVSPPRRNIAHPQVAVGPRGALAVLWDEIVDGRRRVFLSRATDGRPFGTPDALSDEPSALYPAGTFAGERLVVAWTDGESVKVRGMQ